MVRPIKCRKVCHRPDNCEFIPSIENDAEAMVLRLDEYETIRLIDKEGYSQQECSQFMNIARTTVQRIYESARKKMAMALVEGRTLRIAGGDDWLCDGSVACAQTNCFRRAKNQKVKGERTMRIAVTYANGMVFQHFGHTQEFKIYDVEDKKVVSSEVVGTGGTGHGALANVLKSLEVDVLICGGIGGGAKNALANAGITLYGGVFGGADDAVRDFLNGILLFNPNVKCTHHDHDHHHEEGHSCGDHGCGTHSCH